MNFLEDVVTYVRRIVKTPNNSVVSTNLIIDYINRFWIMDVDARLQLFDLKTKYQFQTTPGVHQYNMPLYGVNGYAEQEEGSDPVTEISSYPVYQGFMEPAYVSGMPAFFSTQRQTFLNNWPNYTNTLVSAGLGNGGTTYILDMPDFPALRGHVDMSGVIASGSNVDPIIGTSINLNVPKQNIYPAVWITATSATGKTLVVNDSGQFFTSNQNLGLLTGDIVTTWGATTNVVNYNTGQIYVTFNEAIPGNVDINVQCYFIAQGLPRSILFYNNVITILPPPSMPCLVEMDAYLTPAAFMNTSNAIPFAYMSEYIARGAARKMLSDTGDWDQFNNYEPLFKEQEMLVWKRSQRQFTATKQPTIYSGSGNQGWGNNLGQGI